EPLVLAVHAGHRHPGCRGLAVDGPRRPRARQPPALPRLHPADVVLGLGPRSGDHERAVDRDARPGRPGHPEACRPARPLPPEGAHMKSLLARLAAITLLSAAVAVVPSAATAHESCDSPEDVPIVLEF